MPSKTRSKRARTPTARRSIQLHTPPPSRNSKRARPSYKEATDSEFDYDSDFIMVEQRSLKKTRRGVYTLESDLGSELAGYKDLSINSPVPQDLMTIQERSGDLFKGMAMEIHQKIAGFLPTDRDITAYALASRSSYVAVNESVWRERCVETFDRSPNVQTTMQFATLYVDRITTSKNWVCFDETKHRGRNKARVDRTVLLNNHPKCLQMLRELIVESNARLQIDGTVLGLNIEYIQGWTKDRGGCFPYTDILDAVMNTDHPWELETKVTTQDKNSLVLVIQLCLSFLILRPGIHNGIPHFDLSLAEVYADRAVQPLFAGVWKHSLNVRWMLSTINFFKYHLKFEGEGLLAHLYYDLEPDQLPQSWVGKLKDETLQIGGNWKVAYTYMNRRDLEEFRDSPSENNIFVDDGGSLQDVTLFFDESRFPSSAWPNELEQFIESDPYTGGLQAGTQSVPRSLRSSSSQPILQRYPIKSFFGTTREVHRPGHFYGRIHALPPQHGIPGFQRVCFIMLQPDHKNNRWGYEGCVFPGGNIIIGRWWDATNPGTEERVYSGPFILWKVAESHADPEITSSEAMKYLETLKKEGTIAS